MSNESQPERTLPASVLPLVSPDPAAVVFDIGGGSYIDGYGNIYGSLDAAREIAAARGLSAAYPRVIELNRFQPAVADFLRHDPREQSPVPLAQVQQEPPTRNPVVPPWSPRANPSRTDTTNTDDPRISQPMFEHVSVVPDRGGRLEITIGIARLPYLYTREMDPSTRPVNGMSAEDWYRHQSRHACNNMLRVLDNGCTELENFLLKMLFNESIGTASAGSPTTTTSEPPAQMVTRHPRVVQLDTEPSVPEADNGT